MTSAARSTLLGRIPLVASIVVIGTTLSLLSYHWLRQSDEARVEADFIRRADTRNALTNEVIGKFEAHIFGLRHLFATTGTVSRATFAATAHDIVARNAAISALQWVPVVPAAERPAVEAAASRELGRPFQFTTRGPDGQLVSAPVAAEHLPVLYAESLADRDPMLGYDLALGATAGQLASARRTGHMTVSRFNGPVPGQTEGTGRVAFICPVHRPGADGQAEFIGCVQGVFPLCSMLAESLKLQPGLSLDMLYFDAYETEPTRRLILYLSADGAVSESVFPTEAALRTGLTREKNLSVGDRQWQVLYRASPEWLRSQYSRVPLVYLLACLALTGLSAALVNVLRRRQTVIERQVAERTDELSESRRQLENIVQALPGMVFVCHYEQTMIPLYISDGALELTGYPAADFITGRVQLRDLIHPADLTLVRDLTHAALQVQQPFEVEYRLRTRGGDEKWVLSRGRGVYDAHCRLLCFEGLVIDITARKQVVDGKLALERRLLQNQRLESLGLLAGGVAHEFNNLLTGIVGDTGLARHALPEASPAALPLARIATASQQAAELCQQMLACTGKSRAVVEALDLNSLLVSVLPLLQSIISRHALLQHRPAPDLPRILGNTFQLRQIVMSLVGNASEAIGERPGEITVTTTVTHVPRSLLAACVAGAGLPAGDYVILKISDTGCGMAPETLTRIFDPLFTTKTASLGLGLSAVLGIVRNHGGALHVSSTPGSGSTFRLMLPPATAPAAAPAARS
jgi:PAS domain S-box-containing protein